MQGSKSKFLNRTVFYRKEVSTWDFAGRNQACTYRDIWYWISTRVNEIKKQPMLENVRILM